ncbi:hypothetical protein K435DRAFT_415526 [Dendrothele bispora CBS 962.96]|uniref:Uncharacterized protein n=1 Tax=Dendrothele bispora (strain CBS 962.96) TaxID=1314807 RepID=A0A4S8MUX5_DENBC|nr:hypothetical protein K435DRAFT_415526 [Dendrothele bispora CBS 962.96]
MAFFFEDSNDHAEEIHHVNPKQGYGFRLAISSTVRHPVLFITRTLETKVVNSAVCRIVFKLCVLVGR